MKKYVFRKSQLNEVISHLPEGSTLLKEGNYSQLTSKAQADDYLYLSRAGQPDKRFRIVEIYDDGRMLAIDDKNKTRNVISPDFDHESGVLKRYITGKEQDGEFKKMNTEAPVGDIDTIYLVRNKEPIEQVDSNIDPEEQESDDKKKRAKHIAKRKIDLIDTISNANEGDILVLETGEIDEEGQVQEGSKTNIKLKLENKVD